jgi:NAD(P)-dependent dehydrogenase (short-subunit alcohol dehydrogenase family)
VAVAADFLAPHGGLDTVIYTAGTAPLAPVEDTTATQWHHMLATNLVGAAVIIAGSLPHLRRHSGRRSTVMLASSHSVGDPWPGLVPYAASKAGLETLCRGLRTEEPDLRVVRVAVGPTITAFADGWDATRAGAYLTRWAESGYLHHDVLTAEASAAIIMANLDDPSAPDDITVIGKDLA